MATQTNTQVQKSPIQVFTGILNHQSMQKYLLETLGDKKQEFVANITTLVSNDVKLQECEAKSVIFSALKATALDLPLDPNLGMAYVIPFKNTKKGIKEAQFQIGYKGFTQLAIRSGQFKTINVRDVREGEIIGEDFISGEMQFKRVENREDKPVIGYVACIGSEDAEYRYSGYLSGWIYAGNALAKVDFDAYAACLDRLREEVLLDLRENSIFWGRYESKISEAAETVNNTYLKANNQKYGVRSYGRVVDLMLSWYLSGGV